MIETTIDIYGIFVPALLLLALAAWLCLVLLHRGLARIGFYRAVAHPALADLALYVLILAGLSQWLLVRGAAALP